MHLDNVAVRRAIRDGYQEVRPLPGAPPLWGEARSAPSFAAERPWRSGILLREREPPYRPGSLL